MQQVGEFERCPWPAARSACGTTQFVRAWHFPAHPPRPGSAGPARSARRRSPLAATARSRGPCGEIAESRRRRRRASTPGPANGVRSARRPRAPPCRSARRGCANPAPSAEAAGRAYRGRGVIDGSAIRPAGRCGNRPRGDRNGWTSAGSTAARVGAVARFPHDSLACVNVPRRCCRPGCPHYAVATLTFVYSDSTAVVGPLATVSRTALLGSVRHACRPDHRAARLGAGPACRPAADRSPTKTIWWRWPTRSAKVATGSRDARVGGAQPANGFSDPTGVHGRRARVRGLLAPPAHRTRTAVGDADICACCPIPATDRHLIRVDPVRARGVV